MHTLTLLPNELLENHRACAGIYRCDGILGSMCLVPDFWEHFLGSECSHVCGFPEALVVSEIPEGLMPVQP